jgi:predicted nuclease of predicted toxin-antitoxin system
MNLSPGWVDRLRQHGFEAVHWSTIGAATAPDEEILAWAREHEFVVVTNTRMRNSARLLVRRCAASSTGS